MTDLRAFMTRVDATTSADELAGLQLEFLQYCQQLPAAERKTLVQAYTDQIRQRGQLIAERLTVLENNRISV